jgi:recombination protein RecA
MAKQKKNIPTIKDEQDLIDVIEKAHGSGSIMLGEDAIVEVDSFSTAVPSIDLALGCGGLPQGRIIEIYGPESGGKTTTCLQFISACQKHYFENKKRNGKAAFIDAEHAFDPEWARNMGVDVGKLLFSQPSSGEEAFDIIETMVRSKLLDLIILDSVAALTPQVELDGELGDAHVGVHARMMSKALRKLKGEISDSRTTVVFINQIREKVGVMFGSPETTPGGRALKFYASIRGEVRRGQTLRDGDDVVGFRTSIKMVKNKVAAPFKRAEFDICVGHPERPIYGIDIISSLLEVAKECKVVTTSGSWYVFNNNKLGNGTSATLSYLRNNQEILDEIKKQTYNSAFSSYVSVPSNDDDTLDNEILDGDE